MNTPAEDQVLCVKIVAKRHMCSHISKGDSDVAQVNDDIHISYFNCKAYIRIGRLYSRKPRRETENILESCERARITANVMHAEHDKEKERGNEFVESDRDDTVSAIKTNG